MIEGLTHKDSFILVFFQIHTSLINGRPSADDPSPMLLNFTSARFIRLQFQRIRTLNADLMTLAANDPGGIDLIVSRRVCVCVCVSPLEL